jgi:hypothetical protein
VNPENDMIDGDKIDHRRAGSLRQSSNAGQFLTFHPF